jgi:hypothetical protein
MFVEEQIELIEKLLRTRNDAFIYVILMERAEKIAKENPDVVYWYKNVYKKL